MKTFLTRRIRVFGRAVLATLIVGGFLLLAGNQAFADDCQHRIAKADHKLHEAAARHGWNSPQAERARHELREARERCWNRNHRWWDEEGHRWHTERDWDDHDHDRDRDHDHR
jgi:hypothetical protein